MFVKAFLGFLSMAVTVWSVVPVLVLVLYIAFRIAPILVRRFDEFGEVLAFLLMLLSTLAILVMFNSF